MFTPRQFKPLKRQKRRRSQAHLPRPSPAFNQWNEFFIFGPARLPSYLPSLMQVWGKRLARFPHHTTAFWVNLQARLVLTKKPLNVRMGKGKGGYEGVAAALRSGGTLLRISYLRTGLPARVQRQLQTRSRAPVGVYLGPRSNLGFGIVHSWRTSHRLQAKFIKVQHLALRELVASVHQPQLLEYLRKVFRWRFIAPSAASRLATRRRALAWRYSWHVRRRQLGLYVGEATAVSRQLVVIRLTLAQRFQRLRARGWLRLRHRWFFEAAPSMASLSKIRLAWDAIFAFKLKGRLTPWATLSALPELVSSFSAYETLSFQALTQGAELFKPFRFRQHWVRWVFQLGISVFHELPRLLLRFNAQLQPKRKQRGPRN